MSIFEPLATPKIKTTVQRNDLNNDIYLRTSSRVTEISSGTVYHCLVDIMDGVRTVDEINKVLIEKGFNQDDILEAFKAFDDLYMLEDSREKPPLLTQEELDRWTRNINFFGSFSKLGADKQAPQKMLRDCKVTLLGLGGIGSHILYDLAAIGCKDILAVEFDNVEMSNLNRQILYTPDDVGRSKSEAAKRRIKEFSPDMKFEVYEKKIEGPEDVTDAIHGRDIAICVADRPKMEILYWVNSACVEAGIPLLTGGVDTQVARYYCTQPGQGCLECWRNDVKNKDPRADAILEEQKRTQLRGDYAAFVPFVTIVTGLMMAEFSKMVTGVGLPLNALNQTREIHFSSMDVVTGETWVKNPNCACCGGK